MSEVLEQNKKIDQPLTQDQLRYELAQCTGTTQWYRHTINKNMLYTEGVQFFAENGGNQGAYWFVDKIACQVAPLMKEKNEIFGCITLSVGLTDKHQAMICITDGNEKILATFHIHFTDMQTGDWKFYLIDEGEQAILLLPSEY